MPRQPRACDISPACRPERGLHGCQVAPLEGRGRGSLAERGNHAADRATADARANRRIVGLLRAAFPGRAAAMRRPGWALPPAVLVGGCSGSQSVLAPGAEGAYQIAHLAWILFGLCSAI